MAALVRIGELSRRSGVSPRSLRYYEQHGLLTAERGDNGYREYGDHAVDRARDLHLLFTIGVDRELARAVIACSGDVPDSTHRATRDELGEVLARMTAQIDHLTAARSTLEGIVRRVG